MCSSKDVSISLLSVSWIYFQLIFVCIKHDPFLFFAFYAQLLHKEQAHWGFWHVICRIYSNIRARGSAESAALRLFRVIVLITVT